MIQRTLSIDNLKKKDFDNLKKKNSDFVCKLIDKLFNNYSEKSNDEDKVFNILSAILDHREIKKSLKKDKESEPVYINRFRAKLRYHFNKSRMTEKDLDEFREKNNARKHNWLSQFSEEEIIEMNKKRNKNWQKYYDKYCEESYEKNEARRLRCFQNQSSEAIRKRAENKAIELKRLAKNKSKKKNVKKKRPALK